jgi:hypothetical protein
MTVWWRYYGQHLSRIHLDPDDIVNYFRDGTLIYFIFRGSFDASVGLQFQQMPHH